MAIIKHLQPESILKLTDQVDYLPGQIVSKTLAQDKNRSLTLFAFDKGEEISTHESDGDAMVIALDGEGQITVDGKQYALKAGQTIIMPAKKPHAVFAQERFKMFLIVIFDGE